MDVGVRDVDCMKHVCVCMCVSVGRDALGVAVVDVRVRSVCFVGVHGRG